MVTGTGQGERRWRGREASDRIATRRAQLIEAGVELMGTVGASSMSMRGVCRQAGLTERYFYESFANLDALTVAVLETVVLGARDTLLTALETAPQQRDELIRHEVRAFTDYIIADPRRGRIMLGEFATSTALSTRGWQLVDEFTNPISLAMTEFDTDSRDDVQRNALAVFGALAILYQRWIADGCTEPRQPFEEHIAQIIEQIAGAHSEPAS